MLKVYCVYAWNSLTFSKMLFLKNTFPLKFRCYKTHFHRDVEKSDFFFIIMFFIYSLTIPHMYTMYPDYIHSPLLPTTSDFPSQNIFLPCSYTPMWVWAIHWAWTTDHWSHPQREITLSPLPTAINCQKTLTNGVETSRAPPWAMRKWWQVPSCTGLVQVTTATVSSKV